MSYNYSQYIVALANTIPIAPTDPNFLTEVPNIIDDAEQRMYRELDLLDTIVRDSSAKLIFNNRTFTFPQHFVVSESINLLYPAVSPNTRIQLVPTSREFLDAVYGNEVVAAPSIPQYYAMITDQTIIVGPSPDATYGMEIVGTVRPAPLSATNPTTYLTLYLPDAFFAASMIFVEGYLQNFGAMADNPQSAVSWEAHYNSLIASANIEENRKKYASQAWSPKQPAPLATPLRA